MDGGGNVWFAGTAAGKIGKRSIASGEITEPLTLPFGGEHSGITVVGNDLWFAEPAAGELGSLDSQTGVLREFLFGVGSPLLDGPHDLAVASWVSSSCFLRGHSLVAGSWLIRTLFLDGGYDEWQAVGDCCCKLGPCPGFRLPSPQSTSYACSEWLRILGP